MAFYDRTKQSYIIGFIFSCFIYCQKPGTTTISIMTLSITTISIKGLFAPLCIDYAEGHFERMCALDLISLTFAYTKWVKSKPTFVQTFNEVGRYFSKVFIAKTFISIRNFVPFCLIRNPNLLLCMNIADT
jgi:hypothetical protein